MAGFVKGNGNSNKPVEYEFVDNNLSSGKYLYRLKQIDNDGKFEYSEEIEIEVGTAPLEFELAQNYPNPFNPSTIIRFALPEAGNYSLIIFNTIGEEVAQLINGQMEIGNYSLTFDAAKLASGVYIYNLRGNNVNIVKKMVLLR